MSDVTQILNQIEDGDGQAAERLLPLVYDELRKLAAAKMAKEDPGQTLQPTALVHEAYIRDAGSGRAAIVLPVRASHSSQFVRFEECPVPFASRNVTFRPAIGSRKVGHNPEKRHPRLWRPGGGISTNEGFD